MKKKRLKVYIFLLIFSLEPAMAGTKSISFENTNAIQSSELVINQSSNTIHPPILISGISDSGAKPDVTLDLGDASDGIFDSTTYASFSVGNDVSSNVIRIDTDDYPELNVISFTLDATWTIRPTGSNPLVIRSHGEVIINGTIDCSGEDGEPINASDAIMSLGGVGVCGGTDGGNGGTSSASATNGIDFNVDVTGGGAATGIATDSSGGGGGAYGNPATPATIGAGGNAGSPGDTEEDKMLSYNGAGAGGGGGSSGSDSSSGGGGGAGGGFVYIVSGSDITVAGSINVNGGAGGGGAFAAGGGGGGGGGTVALFSANELQVTGSVTAVAGTGGVANTASGGDGSIGRTWTTDLDSAFNPTAITPFSDLGTYGSIDFETGNLSLQLNAFDSQSSFPELTSVTVQGDLPGISVANIFLYSSSRSDELPNSEFDNLASMLNKKLDRYIYTKITVNSTDANDPVQLTGVTVNWDEYVEDEYEFVSACGSIQSNRSVNWPLSSLFMIPLLFLILLKFTNRTLGKAETPIHRMN